MSSSRAGGSSAPMNKPSASPSVSSSIGKNSEEDVASFDDQVADSQPGLSLNALEDALPMRKGLSEHLGGKLKSYTNLADAAGDSSVVKPEDPYSKKRKNMIAREIALGVTSHEPVNKKPTIATRSTAPNVGGGTSSQEDKSEESDPGSSSSDEKTAEAPTQGP